MLDPLMAPGLAELPNIQHGFFTRQGGVSQGVYAGLNCGFGSNDDVAHVAENRARVARCLHTRADAVLTVHQVHSATAVTVSGAIARHALPKADGLVTRTPGLVIGALSADCAPVLFADAQAGVIGAAHAGWRGAVGGILESTLAAMEELGAHRDQIKAAVGPCISQRNYEVGADFAASLVARNPAFTEFLTRIGANPKPHFDLPGFVAASLRRAGVSSVERQTPCTYDCESLFFSFRRTTHGKEADYGRQISAIVLR